MDSSLGQRGVKHILLFTLDSTVIKTQIIFISQVCFLTYGMYHHMEIIKSN